MSDPVQSLRAFNRFHTRFINVVNPDYAGSGLSLGEARVLYEIATRDSALATAIGDELGIDRARMSRMMRRFTTQGWVERARGSDGRARPVTLTERGREVFAALDALTRQAAEEGLAGLDETGRADVAIALDFVRSLISGDDAALTIREHRPGDMGMIMARQSAMYARDHGWGSGMEAMIGDIVTGFVRGHDPARERCWIADFAGTMAGAVFVVDAGDGVAQLRLLYVEPWARGWGIGATLVDACIGLARDAGYREIMLWTHSRLHAARAIYEHAGFTLRSTEIHDEFGMPEQGETWAMALDRDDVR